MKKIDVASVRARRGAGYPPPYDAPCLARVRQALGDAGGLTQFGVNLLTLEPGVWSSQRHWHSTVDEFVWVVEGEVTLVTNAGEEILRPGDCAAFPPAGPTGIISSIARTPSPRFSKSGAGVRTMVASIRTPTFSPSRADSSTARDGAPYPKA